MARRLDPEAVTEADRTPDPGSSGGRAPVTFQDFRCSLRRRAFVVRMKDREWTFPFDRCDPPPTREDPVVALFCDVDVGTYGFGYFLRSGGEGFILADQVLDHHADPDYVHDLILHRLTCAALNRLKLRRMPKREIARRLETSTTQVYRLLDTCNYEKSMSQVVKLLYVLGCEVDVTVTPREEWLAALKARREAEAAASKKPAT